MVARVRAALAASGLTSEIVVLPGAARTAQLAADALGCEVAQIANSLVFKRQRSGTAVLVMASGAHRVDEARIADAIGEPVGKADAAFVREQTGFAIGGVAPVGHATALSPLVDRTLTRFARIWAAAGHPNTVFALTPDELVRITGGTLADVARAA
jgi:prolyl-tRNA editing enzyme YbaK/EbsC (Cys-tRNA(Pro) deacylase)